MAKKLKLSIRECLLFTLIVALALGWYAHCSELRAMVNAGNWRSRTILMRLEGIQNDGFGLSDEEVIDLIAAITDPYPAVGSTADSLLRKESGIEEGFGSVFRTTQEERLLIAMRWSKWFLERSDDDASDSLIGRDPELLRRMPETVGEFIVELGLDKYMNDPLDSESESSSKPDAD